MSSANSIRLTSLILVLGGVAGISYGQQVLSAQSGTVHFTEGPVYLEGREIHPKFGQFPTLRPGEELRTEDGRAELLLTPGAFLRVAEHSAVRMVDNRLSDTRIEVLEGSVIVECDALLKDNALTLLYAGSTIRLEKHGLYRVDTVPAQLRVYDGEAVVESASGDVTLKRGKETALNGVVVAEKFNRKVGDGFDLWDADRSALLANASVSASQSLLNNKSSWNASGWAWSPSYDMFTFVPGGGSLIFSPFGYQFWSPAAMSYYYVPNSGYRGSSTSSSGSTITSGVSSSPSSSGGGFGSGGISSGGGSRSVGGGGGGAAVAPAGGGHRP
jgi:hypothetical protein